jgi:hypothetical protein
LLKTKPVGDGAEPILDGARDGLGDVPAADDEKNGWVAPAPEEAVFFRRNEPNFAQVFCFEQSNGAALATGFAICAFCTSEKK